jgi:adenylate cyclase
MSLIQELKRRNVFRVAVAYIIVGWLLLQVSDTLVPALLLPEWMHSAIALLLILGFPVSIIFAWAFEMTPEGVRREHEVDRTQSITRHTGRKLDFAIIAALVLAVIYFATDKFLLRDDANQNEEIIATSVNPSIAVLPFINMSDDASNEYFADGITEELLNLLAKIPEFDVTSRSSAFAFKGKDIDIPTVAEKLNVDHILEGSVRKAGVTVRITAQLIEAGTDRHMWSETYDRELTDIFAIQDEIAKEVVDVLQVRLLGAAPVSLETDTVAYSYYLEGQHYLERDRESDYAKALKLFDQALAIDPTYTPAMVGQARAIREMANYGNIDLDEGMEQAREITLRALEINPSLAEAWALLAHIQFSYDWDWVAGRATAEKALAVDPSNSVALDEVGRIDQIVGRLDASLENRLEAARLDPLNGLRLYELGMTYWYLDEYDKALEVFLRNVELNPNINAANLAVALVLLSSGNLQDSKIWMDREKDPTNFNWGMAFLAHEMGDDDAAAAALRFIVDERGIPMGYQIAEMYAYQGRPDEAFEWLDISYDNHDGGMGYLLIDPLTRSLHDDPRWRPLVEKMNLLEYWDAMPGR